MRCCTMCLTRDRNAAAVAVAASATGLEWFECAEHSETDNVAGERRVGSVPIAIWFARMPGAVAPA